MFAHAIDPSGEGGCRRRDPYDLAAVWSAMTGRAGGSGRGGGHRREGSGGRARHGEHGRYGPRYGGGPLGFAAFGGGGGRWRKARRGDIRTAALLLLAEEPRNGYQIMQEVEERSGGAWRPSPGSVYPALAQLEDEGLIGAQETDGRKLLALTDAGRELIAQRDEDKPAPWEEMSGDASEPRAQLGRLMREVAFAFGQVMRTGSETQITAAREVLASARRELYGILAEGDD
jgi:DNA-binding PadR family transcriptional regulator